MSEESARSDYEVRHLPFEEWTDLDTLMHRTAVTSGDFDYVLSPLCPECGMTLESSYSDTDAGESILEALICETCAVTWRPSSAEES